MSAKKTPQTVPASKYAVPPVLTNHVQMMQIENMVFLEFRTIVPDTFAKGAGAQGQSTFQIVPDFSQIPPHTRLVLPLEVAKQFKAMLNNNLGA